MIKTTSRIILLFILCLFLVSWGWQGHQTINSKCPASFPASMAAFQIWTDSLASNASNADTRKNKDSGLPLYQKESYKHYIDIDNYSEFLSTGRIASTYDSIVAIHGSSNVIYDGTLPWATVNMYDTLVVDFKKLKWHKAMLDASDLGHYVADGHMPLHLTSNFDGKATNQDGIHSRYEGNMVSDYITSLSNYTGEPVNLVSNVNKYIFTYIYTNYHYIDSVLAADSYAKKLDPNYSSTYYAALWSKSHFTTMLFHNASHSLAELIYTAWVEAGSPAFGVTSFISDTTENEISVYPNPTSGVLNLNSDNILKVEAFTITGTIVGIFYNKHIDLSNLPNGMYILSIYGKEGILKKEKILLAK